MLTSKQRAYLRGLANTLEPALLIGKGGLSGNMTEEIDAALEANELIKIKILNNSMEEPGEVSRELAGRLGAEVVQVIGGKFVLYRQSEENPTIVLP
ncbi:MAG TPA: ribosome assembly RNA-binding protein YhbY [Clostridia bacterium]|nr:ribosome assembly RNA-binding protein YhbY [Clostridia bacterium]